MLSIYRQSKGLSTNDWEFPEQVNDNQILKGPISQGYVCMHVSVSVHFAFLVFIPGSLSAKSGWPL